MGLLTKGLSAWVQSRLDPCPNEQNRVILNMMNDNGGLTVFIQVLAVMQNVKKRNYVRVMFVVHSSHGYIVMARN